MQQMNNILLAPSAKNGASSGKTMSQDTNSEDFSVALASVTSTSTPSTKTRVSQEAPVKSSQSETNVDESDTDDKADINLIFAQIGMANEMKKAAAPGEALPLDADIIATEDAEPASSFILSSALPQADEPVDVLPPAEESIVVGSFSDELARFSQSNVTDEVEADATLAKTTNGTDKPTTSQALSQSISEQSNSQSAAKLPQLKIEDITDTDSVEVVPSVDIKAVALEEPDAQGVLVDDSQMIDDASLLTGKRTEKFVKPPENHILPIDGEPILGSKELGTKEMELSGKVMNMPTPRTDTAMSPLAMDNQASIKASASDVDILQVNAASVSNVKDSNSLGSVSIDPDLATENPSRAEISAGFLLKDAKLAVSLDTQQDSRLTSFNTDESSGVESKPVEFKPVSSLHSLTTQVTNRQDIPQVQLSLRQGLETQNQMQEMIQRFSPVMKQQLVTMVSQGIQQAEIRLDPPELGHMLVKVQVHGDQTQVQFHVTQSQTRDVVEQAIPRLRELLQEQGMQLADSHVSHGDQGQRREGGFGEAGGSGSGNMDDFSAEELDLGLNQATSLNSGIDYYA
ncbi:flagellar hook-length control protein FliK [Shewanella decolorationis]|uniref:flagellar hook-length control protein FliK n=1 Tax=Shewanella decolorationis TaxID=256839 RepID=UPI001056EF2F|nr:flagellar hook-length control protein FliK [Shewanella decolorationis]